ncbi:class II lanthipeptide, LchA2/BrtA2 family [Streptococcus sp. A18]|uniref:class II lanthipeptide, LchA2/BrtA2 family n=1 Tax=Streptococcus sp. A18 TaxID=3373125 RepID=UPI00374C90FE
MIDNTLQLGKYSKADMLELTEEDVNGAGITVATPFTPQIAEVTAVTVLMIPTTSCTSRC